ncbi:unnamed protein product, partial [Pylaiella littoralis]
QVGIPPETIKDSMELGLPVPQYYVMPSETLCRTLGNSLGVNVAEFEFPAYYNFFLKNQKVKLIVDSMDAEKRIRALMQETLLGPEKIDASIDFDRSVPVERRPDIAKELSYFRVFNGKELSVDLLITFIHMDTKGTVTIQGTDGTPGADWCVTITTSDYDGGAYIITEHQRGADPPAPVNSLECQDTKSDAVEVREAEDVSEKPRRGEGRKRGEGSRGEESEQKGDGAGQGDGGERVQHACFTPEAEIRGDGKEQGGSGITKHAPSLPEKEGSLNCESSSYHKSKLQSSRDGGSGASHEPLCTPIPPRKNSVPVQPSKGGSTTPSPVTRFARWIVQRAHKGEKNHGNAGGKDADRPPPLENGEICSKADHNLSSRITRPTNRGGTSSAPKSSYAGRAAASSIRGFKPVRMVKVLMTCPLPTTLRFHPAQREEEFDAPTFGTTVLGNSHGFDPKGSTSGYVLWINGRGYMIDPPPYASMILQAFNIRPSLIAGIIVTHCHADHDAGTFQKVLLDGQVNIISTRTIYESFIRKYTALSGISAHLIRSSHKFTPVTIGQSLRLDGALFNFSYTLHSIPCVCFEVAFKGKSMVFSADHMNDPARIRAMCEEGFLSEGRRDDLLDFPWHHDIIFHEAGIPPIHTPMQTLQELPHDVKKRLYVVHVSESSIPEGSGLKVAPAGVENTIRLETEANHHSEAIAILELISSVGVLGGVSISQARSLLEVGRTTLFEANTTIQNRNIDTTEFAIICHGKAIATVVKEADCRHSYATKKTILRRGDCYGEELLLARSSRLKADRNIRAVTDMEVLMFNGQDLEHIFGFKTKPLEDAYRLDRLLVYNSVLNALSRKQTLQLETFTEAQTCAAGEMVWRAGDPVQRVVFVAKGRLAFVGTGKRELVSGCYPSNQRIFEGGERPRLCYCPDSFLPGSMIGRAGTVLDPPGSNHYLYSLQAVVDSVVLVISREDMVTFSYSNPGVFMAIHDLVFVC